MKKLTTRIVVALGFFAGSTTMLFAQIPAPQNSPSGSGSAMGESLINLLRLAQNLVNIAVPLLIGVAVVALFVGVLMFLFGKKDPESHKKLGGFLAMAVLSLFVMVSIWGLVNFLGSILNIGQGGGIPVPQVPPGIR